MKSGGSNNSDRQKHKDISDRQLSIFLVLATFISLVSVWTVIFSLDFDIMSGQPITRQITIIREAPQQPSLAIVGLVISPNPENLALFGNQTNGTIQ